MLMISGRTQSGRIYMDTLKKTLFLVCVVAVAGAGALFAGGSKEKLPPTITVEKGEVYLSPTSSPGKMDSLVIPIKIEADKDNKMVIKEYKLVIANEAGSPVREWKNRDEREPGFFSRLFISMGFMDKPALEVPETITWDGKNDSGAAVPDGTYSYVLEAWDDAGATAKSEPKKIIVDNTPPSAEVRFAYTTFSPNGDGKRDTLQVMFSGSEERSWNAVVKDASGKEVAKTQFSGKLPAEFYWTGKNEADVKLPDGDYTLVLSAEDLAGNSFSLNAGPVRIDTKDRGYALGIDYKAFSPNGDGVQDSLTITPANLSVEGLIEASLELLDEKGLVRRTVKTAPPLPTSIVFDGKDESGKTLPDGMYTVRGTAVYENGTESIAVTDAFGLDTTPPKAEVRVSTPIFSPNGDGNKDEVTLLFDVSKPALWKGTVVDEKGKLIISYELDGIPPKQIVLDGKDADGKVLPDGTYTAFLEGRDAAGNIGASNKASVVIDTRPSTLTAATDLPAFSPNGDGVKDRILIKPILDFGRETEAYRLSIRDSGGKVVRSIEEEKRVPADIPWDGKDDAGKVVSDGTYSAELLVTYINGNEPKAAVKPFILDTVFPEATVKVDGLTVRQDVQGSISPITVTQETSKEDLWTGELVSLSTNKTVAKMSWPGTAKSFSWAGAGEDGRMVGDDKYLYRLWSEDLAGNKKTVEIRDLIVETLKPDLTVTPAVAAFSPNGDGVSDDISFDISSSITAGLTGWSLSFVKDGVEAASLKSNGAAAVLPRTVTWNGKTASGATAADGSYTAVLTADFGGKKISAESRVPFRIDTMPPAARIEIKPRPFSPDHDGTEDLLDIMLSAVDESPLEDWTLRIQDPENRDFISFAGKGNPPATIVWDGYSSAGDLVKSAKDYPLHFTVKDNLGNEAKGSIKIAVDILVYREGMKDRIRVANIQFEGYTTDYLKWNAEVAKENVASLDEIAMMLKLYPKYRVRLEGHAVSVLWEDKAASEREHKYILIPLSQNRSAVIKQALMDRGIPESRIETQGFGGDHPLVPFSDLEKRWINRRVEFILLRQ
jgi:flagellar hook assembly protein FlgD